LNPFHGIKATSMFWPSASSPRSVDAPSADHVRFRQALALLHDRALLMLCSVRARVLGQLVDVDAHVARDGLVVLTRTTMRLAST